jgi:hypothetical protein
MKRTACTLAVFLIGATALFAQELPPPDAALLQSVSLQHPFVQSEQVTVKRPSEQIPREAQSTVPHRDWTPSDNNVKPDKAAGHPVEKTPATPNR